MYSIKDIEKKANHVLLSYFKSKGRAVKMPIDPIDILESKGFSIDYVNDKYDKNIYGALQLEEKTVEVNADISFNKGMENFTIAHEIGHIELHAPLLNDKDTSCNPMLEHDNDQIEKEADTFAACLLMPERNVKDIFYKIRRSPLVLRDNFLFRFLGKGNKRKRALNFASVIIKEGQFNVSKYAMINRLITLRLLRGIGYQNNKYNYKRRS